jgi:AcrR family transcriptional regulator
MVIMHNEPGLRERKKQLTREAIAAAAFDLFVERGFEGVTVAAVARQATVSEATVFNYFPTKEDLVFGRLEEFEAGLVQAVRARPPGQPVLAAFGEFLMGSHGLLGSAEPEARAKLAAVSRIIADSPALQARERQVYDRYTRTLAAIVAEQRGVGSDDFESWVVANAVIGVHRGLVEFVRRSVLAGRSGPGLTRATRAQAKRALAVLGAGLAEYGPAAPHRPARGRRVA